MISLTKLKVYALGILGALAGAFLLKKRGDIYRDQRDTARANERAVEKRSTHQAATTEADRDGAVQTAERVLKAQEKARSGDRTHFE